MKYRYIFKKAHFASYTLKRMMLEKNRRTIKHPCMKGQKGQKGKKLIGIKDKKAVVSMAIKALQNVKDTESHKRQEAEDLLLEEQKGGTASCSCKEI